MTGQTYVEVSLWPVLFPSVAIRIAVFGLNLPGDVLDPRLKGLQGP